MKKNLLIDEIYLQMNIEKQQNLTKDNKRNNKEGNKKSNREDREKNN